MFFVTSILHVHLMLWDDVNLVEAAVNQCDQVWQTIQSENVCTYFIISLAFYSHATGKNLAFFCSWCFFQCDFAYFFESILPVLLILFPPHYYIVTSLNQKETALPRFTLLQ